MENQIAAKVDFAENQPYLEIKFKISSEVFQDLGSCNLNDSLHLFDVECLAEEIKQSIIKMLTNG